MVKFANARNSDDGKTAGWVALIDDQGDEMWRGWVSPVPNELWATMQDACGLARLCALCGQPFGPEDVETTPPGTDDVVHVCCWYGRCEHPRATNAPKPPIVGGS